MPVRYYILYCSTSNELKIKMYDPVHNIVYLCYFLTIRETALELALVQVVFSNHFYYYTMSTFIIETRSINEIIVTNRRVTGLG